LEFAGASWLQAARFFKEFFGGAIHGEIVAPNRPQNHDPAQ
jgi:hypothetical protein